MPKTLNFKLADSELKQILQAIKSDKRPEVRQRAMGLRLLHEGHSPTEVAELMGSPCPPFTTGTIAGKSMVWKS